MSVLYWRGLLEFTLSNSNYEGLLEKCFVHFMFVDLSNRMKVVKWSELDVVLGDVFIS